MNKPVPGYMHVEPTTNSFFCAGITGRALMWGFPGLVFLASAAAHAGWLFVGWLAR